MLLRRRHTSESKVIDYSLYENQYLTTEALESGNIEFDMPAGVPTYFVTSISYRKNNGSWVLTNKTSSDITITIPVVAGDIIEWKGIVPRSIRYPGSTPYECKFVAGGASFNVYGNVLSLFWGDNFIGQTVWPWKANNAAASPGASALFMGSNVVDASNLILPVLDLTGPAPQAHAYSSMFKDCLLLTYPPETLPATIIGTYSYYQMFMGCTSLLSMPDMESITDIPSNSRAVFGGMFEGCTALQYNTQQTLHINRAVWQGCSRMFYGCTSLVNAPNIEVYEYGDTVNNTGTAQAFDSMFQNCTSLETPPERLDITEIDNTTFARMFAGCTELLYAPIINIRNIRFIDSTLTSRPCASACLAMFQNCTSLVDASGINIYIPASAQWNGTQTFQNMFQNCTALVNGASLHINGTVITTYNQAFYQLYQSCSNLQTFDMSLNYEVDSGATVSNYGCYRMLHYCGKLLSSPYITRHSLCQYEFTRALEYCNKLLDVWINVDTDASGNGIRNYMANISTMSGVTRTVHQAGSLTLPTSSVSGVPSGWTLDTTDWTSQRHVRMTMYLDKFPELGVYNWYDANDDQNRDVCIQHFINNLSECTKIFDYYGDTITINNKTYFIWENREYVNNPLSDNAENVAILLTTTDNFYELTQASLERDYDASMHDLGKGNYYELLYALCHSDNTIEYDSDDINSSQTFIVAVKRNQG